ncbi:hypothetical protein BDR07DRAFT_1385044 [Suillus spraguei]|nr:hypothetical protein BDR07DRAFT_1385044 [Suillus spraguei]
MANANEQWYGRAGADDDIGKVAGVTEVWELSKWLLLGAGGASGLSGVSASGSRKVLVMRAYCAVSAVGVEKWRWFSDSGNVLCEVVRMITGGLSVAAVKSAEFQVQGNFATYSNGTSVL